MQFVVTPATGKRMIAKGIARHHAVQSALQTGTVVVVAGTTTGYVAEELLALIGEPDGFDRQGFFRGITLPPSYKTTEKGRLPDRSRFPGDVIITQGKWQRRRTIVDVIDDLKEGDVILKGANALDLQKRQAAVLISDPKGGTSVVALQAIVGRRVRLILPVGLEKRVSVELNDIARLLNAPGFQGPRLLPVPGEVMTEIEALAILTGAHAELIAGGGVCGAEGAGWLAVSGSGEQVKKAREFIESIADEPLFAL